MPNADQKTRWVFEAIGTVWTVDLDDPPPGVEGLRRAVMDRIARFDAAYSRFRRDSLVAALAARPGNYDLGEDGARMMGLCRQLYDLTGGAFTPLIGETLAEAGYDAAYSLRPRALTPPPAWDEVLKVDGSSLTTARPVRLDFGGVGKGYIVDLVGGILEDAGCRSFCVDAGGDLLRRSDGPISVGLEHPLNPKQAIGIARLGEGSLCGSSGLRRRWGPYHHILDPRVLASPEEVIATWVAAPTATVADALATCLFLVEPQALAPHFQFSYLVLKKDLTVDRSPEFPAEIFYAESAAAATP